MFFKFLHVYSHYYRIYLYTSLDIPIFISVEMHFFFDSLLKRGRQTQYQDVSPGFCSSSTKKGRVYQCSDIPSGRGSTQCVLRPMGMESISASLWACLSSRLSLAKALCIIAAWDKEPSGFWRARRKDFKHCHSFTFNYLSVVTVL